MSPLEGVLARLEGVRPSGRGYTARCPAHEDRQASLSVSEGAGGAVLLKCFAGCDTGAVVAALGLTMRDLFPPSDRPTNGAKPARRIVKTFPYVNEAGEVLFEVVRYAPKEFRQRRPGPGLGEWVWNLEGVRRVLYRLPEVVAGVERGAPVWIAEGEKDAEALAALGLVGTTSPQGAGKWRPEYSEPLRGAKVILLPDNDEPGRRHAQDVAAALAGTAARVRVLSLPGLPEKGDVSDWLAAGGTRGELLRLAKGCPEWQPSEAGGEASCYGIRMCDVEPERVAWLWPGRIPFGKLTVLDGDPGLGKSTLCFDLAARLSQGRRMPDGARPECDGPAAVLVLSAEDGLGDTIRPRLEAAGADLARVVALPLVGEGDAARLPGIPDDLGALEVEVIACGARLVIIDPLMAYLGKDVNSYRDQDVRRALAPLAALAERTGAAVFLVRHFTKNDKASAVQRGGGSIGIIGAARSALLVAPDPQEGGRVVLAGVKANLARLAPSLAFAIRPADNGSTWVEWFGEVGYSAEALIATRPADADGGAALADAREFLLEELADGPRAVTELLAAARRAGHAEKTLQRARKALGAGARKVSMRGGWEWFLPPEGGPPAEDGHTPGTWPSSGALASLGGRTGTNGPRTGPEDGQREGFAPLAPFAEAEDLEELAL